MKVVIVLAALIAVAIAEPCQSDDECRRHGITSCAQGHELHCVNNECDCTLNTGNTCLGLADCHRDMCTHDQEVHCIDGHCRCRNRPGDQQ